MSFVFDRNFPMDERKRFFLPHRAEKDASGNWKLMPASATDETAFFTGYERGGRFITFFGDNHPAFNGNVVKAMASARKGYLPITNVLLGDLPERPAAAIEQWDSFRGAVEDHLSARVVEVNRLTPTIVGVVVRAPAAAKAFEPGQFYRLQNFEAHAPVVEGSPLLIEPLALTGAWVDAEKGLLSMIALELGASSRLCAALKPGEPVLAMGPTGAPRRAAGRASDPAGPPETPFSSHRRGPATGNRVPTSPATKKAGTHKREDVEAAADSLVLPGPRRDDSRAPPRRRRVFVGNIVEALAAYGPALGEPPSRCRWKG
jgi:hypothetical protein